MIFATDSSSLGRFRALELSKASGSTTFRSVTGNMWKEPEGEMKIVRRSMLGSGSFTPRIALAAGLCLFASTVSAETYRLVHALGNKERFVAKGLSKAECAARKREHIKVAEALGIHSERMGIGSITCLPESLFSGD